MACATCDDVGHVGPATGAEQRDYGRACPDCGGCEHAGAPTGQMISNGQTDPADSSKLLVVRLCPDCGDRVEFSVPKYTGGAARYGRGYYRRRR